MQGNFLKVFNTYLVGINQANGFKTHNELTMYSLGNYPLAPSVGGPEGPDATVLLIRRIQSQ